MGKLILWNGILLSVILFSLSHGLQHAYQQESVPNWVLYSVVNEDDFSSVALYRANVDTGEQQLLTDHLTHNGFGVIHYAGWSPDGRWTYFKARDENGANHLYRQNIASDTPEIVIENWEVLKSQDFRDLGGTLRWTPDGQWIIHQRGVYEDVDDPDTPPAEIPSWYVFYRMRPDGSDVEPFGVETDTRSGTYLTTSPDGEWMYFSLSAPDTIIYRVNMDGQQREIITNETYGGNPAGWSANEQWFYFTTYHTQTTRGLRRINIDSGEIEILLPQPGDEDAEVFNFTRWIEQGAEFIYRVEDQYYSYDIESGEKTYLMQIIGGPYSPILSPDRQWLYSLDASGIYRLPVGTDTEPELLVTGDQFRHTFDDDFAGFYYTIVVDDQPQYFYFDLSNLTSEPINQLDYLQASTSEERISPDGSYIVLPNTDDVCYIGVSDEETVCLSNEAYPIDEEFLGWAPVMNDTSWHPTEMKVSSLLLGSGLLSSLRLYHQ